MIIYFCISIYQDDKIHDNVFRHTRKIMVASMPDSISGTVTSETIISDLSLPSRL